MTRMTDAILGNKAHGTGSKTPMVDLKYGGHFGWAPVLGEWVSSAAYKRQNVIPILLQEPVAFQALPNPEYWTNTLKALVEQHPQTIDGLNATYEVETAETPVGGGGQRQLEFVNVTEGQTNVNMTWTDKYGMPIRKFWQRYITYLMMDPNSKVSVISTLEKGRDFTDWLPDMYSFSMLFIEPDPHHVSVTQAWIVSNMFPQNSGEIVGRRDITAGLELATVDIPFGGIAQFGPGVDEYAQTVLDSINITGCSPLHREAFIKDISANVAAGDSGYRRSVEKTGLNAVKF